MEVYANAKVIMVGMLCDKCGNGYMIADTTRILSTFPPKYECTCDNCGAVKVYDHPYPYNKIVQDGPSVPVEGE